MKNKLAIILKCDWEKAKTEVPEIAKEILSYYVHKWVKDDVDKIIQEVWDNKLTSPTYPYGGCGAEPWYVTWDKVKVWWVADKLEDCEKTMPPLPIDTKEAKG